MIVVFIASICLQPNSLGTAGKSQWSAMNAYSHYLIAEQFLQQFYYVCCLWAIGASLASKVLKQDDSLDGFLCLVLLPVFLAILGYNRIIYAVDI